MSTQASENINIEMRFYLQNTQSVRCYLDQVAQGNCEFNIFKIRQLADQEIPERFCCVISDDEPQGQSSSASSSFGTRRRRRYSSWRSATSGPSSSSTTRSIISPRSQSSDDDTDSPRSPSPDDAPSTRSSSPGTTRTPSPSVFARSRQINQVEQVEQMDQADAQVEHAVGCSICNDTGKKPAVAEQPLIEYAVGCSICRDTEKYPAVTSVNCSHSFACIECLEGLQADSGREEFVKCSLCSDVYAGFLITRPSYVPVGGLEDVCVCKQEPKS